MIPTGIPGVPEDPADQGGAKRGMIDVGITSYEDYIKLPDTQLFPFLKRHGEKQRLPGS